MEIINWIGKKKSEIERSLTFGKYFDSTLLDKGSDVFYLFNPNAGIDLVLDENLLIKTIHLFSGRDKTAMAFIDELPFKLSFLLNREQTRQLLGPPSQSGGGDFSLIYGTAPQWDKYKLSDVFLHLQFEEKKEELDLVTLSGW